MQEIQTSKPSYRFLTAGCKFIFLLIPFLAFSESVRAEEAIDLRGYGKVSAAFTSDRVIFQCETDERADVFLDKLLADLFWDQLMPVEKMNIPVGSSTLTVHSISGQGALLVARAGNRVIALSASDPTLLAALAAKEPLLLGADVTSRAAKPRPLYLDYYDNLAFKAYTLPMKSQLKLGLESHWPFIKKFGLAGIAFYGATFHEQNPAPNVVDWVASDFEVREAEKNGGLVEPKPLFGESPLWVYNTQPERMMKASDTTLLGEWGGAGMAGGHYASRTDSEQPGLVFMRKQMERYKSSPALGGWHFMIGSPGAEYAWHDRASSSWDTSIHGQEGWRHWLKDVCHWSLSDLGTRWYGDAKHFKTWDEVKVPDQNEFFGQLGDDSFRIQNGWQWQLTKSLDDEPAEKCWVPVAMPPSQQQAFLPKDGTDYFENTIDPGAWWKQQKDNGAKDAWLVLGGNGAGSDDARITWNGSPLTLPKDPNSKWGPFAVRVTDSMKPGPNQLRIGLNGKIHVGKGKLAGPVFLTVHEPKHIPHLGMHANARCYDLIEWRNWAYYQVQNRMYEIARKIDPERSLLVSPGGGANANLDYACQLAVDYGIGCQNTGREAYYAPWWGSFGLVNGFYGTSEWSATPKKDLRIGDLLDRGFGWIMFDADSNHSLYHDIEDFQMREKMEGWMTRHQRQIQLFGKYLREQPKVALFRSVEGQRLESKEANAWDIGRGDLQSAHYENVYVSEREIKSGLVNRYPVLIDTGSEFMEPDVVVALRKYVENGGTFVALHNSGRYTALNPDANPLLELSGFKVVGNEKRGKVKFEPSLPIFKGWEGKQFEGHGKAVDHMNNDHAKGANLSFAPDSKSAIPLAKWDDGSVAVGFRKIGKGQVIVLGSTFWRQGKDEAGVWRSSQEVERQFLDRLLTDLGVARTSTASLPEIWTRRVVTKNGLQNWLVAFNSVNEAHTGNVWLATDEKPDQVFDLETNTPVPFVVEQNGALLKNVEFKPYELKMYAVRRRSIVNDLSVWWQEKLTYWRKTPAQIAATKVVLPEKSEQKGAEETIPLESWRFRTDPDTTISRETDWTKLSFDDSDDDSGWKTSPREPWTFFDSKLKDYQGVGLYRIKFTVPSSWNGRQILLSLYSWDTPIVYDIGDFYVNGTKVASYQAHGWSQTLNYDITSNIHPGENSLAIQVTGGEKLGGLGGAIWIESRTTLSPVLDLKSQWKTVDKDWVTNSDYAMPAKVTAKYLTCEVPIPADWKGRNVYLDWSSKNQWVGSVVVNGIPISYNSYVHPFPLLSRVNITPSLKAGALNTIELWPLETTTIHDYESKTGESKNIQLDRASVGCK